MSGHEEHHDDGIASGEIIPWQDDVKASNVTVSANNNDAPAAAAAHDDDHQTPYQIFRNTNSTVASTASCLDCLDVQLDDDQADTSQHEHDIDDDLVHNENTPKAFQSKNHQATFATANTTSQHGALSPNSIEIRQNARKLLLQQPKSKMQKKQTKKKRRSLQPISLSSFINVQNGSSSNSYADNINGMNKTKSLLSSTSNILKERVVAVQPKPATTAATNATFHTTDDATTTTERNIQQELTDDIQEIKEAFAETFEKMEMGFEALSTGARRKARKSLSVIGQLWE
mmetsp:Transcript_6945/g.15324  ORF Transcript_6945/g.15324 Transcript_6945/m.15324 type:complete len:287 (+) Transcript_6945:31-891(+)